MALEELEETYTGTTPEEEEIDALAEMTAAEAIQCEERHEELMTCVYRLEENQQRMAETMNQIQTLPSSESPILANLQTQVESLRVQNAEILAQLANLKSSISEDSRLSSRPPQHQSGNPPETHQEASEGTRTEASTVEASEAPAAQPAAPKARRRVI